MMIVVVVVAAHKRLCLDPNRYNRGSHKRVLSTSLTTRIVFWLVGLLSVHANGSKKSQYLFPRMMMMMLTRTQH